MSERQFFIAHRGRVVHESDGVQRPLHGHPIRALCGAGFNYRWRLTEWADAPTCPKCLKVLADRAALVDIAAALNAEYGPGTATVE